MAKCKAMEDTSMSDEIAIISTEQMKSLIYEIRGQKVMLDKDLAKIYGLSLIHI